MTARPIDAYFDRLETSAREANVAEENYRKEAASRIKELERARAFAFRRLNLLKTIAGAMKGAENEAEAFDRGRTAFLHEVNWSGTSEAQRQVLDLFQPVFAALWRMNDEQISDSDFAQIDSDLAGFEKWFSENRNGPFLSLMDSEPLELPLVETC